jgi:hypothetical protein
VVALVSANFSSSGHFFSDGYSAPVANFGTSATFSATAVIGGEAYADFTVYTQFSATTVKVGG